MFATPIKKRIIERAASDCDHFGRLSGGVWARSLSTAKNPAGKAPGAANESIRTDRCKTFAEFSRSAGAGRRRKSPAHLGSDPQPTIE
jgi:hypothetical protein